MEIQEEGLIVHEEENWRLFHFRFLAKGMYVLRGTLGAGRRGVKPPFAFGDDPRHRFQAKWRRMRQPLPTLNRPAASPGLPGWWLAALRAT
jgi:hypothetical protein